MALVRATKSHLFVDLRSSFIAYRSALFAHTKNIGAALVRIVALLVEQTARDVVVERRLEGLLGIVEERCEAIPAGGSEGARRVDEAGEGHRDARIRCIVEGLGVHDVGRRVVEGFLATLVALGAIALLGRPRVGTDAGAEAVDAPQVGLDVGAPLAGNPGVAAVLEADRGIGREDGGAASRRDIESIAARIRADTIVINLVEVVVAIPSQGLLFCGTGHLMDLLIGVFLLGLEDITSQLFDRKVIYYAKLIEIRDDRNSLQEHSLVSYLQVAVLF
jgi:hypothetical protein